MKFLTIVWLVISSLSLFAQDTSTNAVTTPPPIPEEARKHFVMGTALFKDAKTADDFAQVTGEFKQAADLAPQWPEARYNLALSKEAAGDLSGAMADLKLYQSFKLSDTEARTVQDKIYVLEAKQAKLAKQQTDKKAAEKQSATGDEAVKNELNGARWRMDCPRGVSMDFHIEIECHGNTIAATRVCDRSPASVTGYYAGFRQPYFKTHFERKTFIVPAEGFMAQYSNYGEIKGVISEDGEIIKIQYPACQVGSFNVAASEEVYHRE